MSRSALVTTSLALVTTSLAYLNNLQVACRLRMIEMGSSLIVEEDEQLSVALKTLPCPKTTAKSKMSSKISAEHESSISSQRAATLSLAAGTFTDLFCICSLKTRYSDSLYSVFDCAAVVAARTKLKKPSSDLCNISSMPHEDVKICSLDLHMLVLDGQIFRSAPFVSSDSILIESYFTAGPGMRGEWFVQRISCIFIERQQIILST
jgi:hypothetical protein